MDHPQPGDTFFVKMGWTLPEGHRLHATFEVYVEAVELTKSRVCCQLLRLTAAGGNRPEAEVDSLYFDRLTGLIGKRAMIPLDALQGIVLPLRLTTLMGEHPYFSD